MRLEIFGSEGAGTSYLLNELGIGFLVALIVVNIYGIYFYRKNKSKKKILFWWIVIDFLLVIGMILFGIVTRTTFQ